MAAITDERQPITFTEVTLRDGEQQEKRAENMPISDRLDIFDTLVDSGMRRIEIGHLANEHDVALARAIVGHIHEKEVEGDTRYSEVELQVLFGSQEDMIEPGLEALEGFDKNQVVVHVYDRLSSALRNLAAEPKSSAETAESVVAAAQKAYDAGYTRFSVSGEGAMNHDDSIEEAIGYYTYIIEELVDMGAQEINANVADTFGVSIDGEWDEHGLAHFNRRVKATSDTIPITTSIHVHNDMNSAVEVSMAAIRAGFDRIEGTMIGMGERAGNVALVDVMARFIESGRNAITYPQRRLGSLASKQVFWENRCIPREILDALDSWHSNAQNIAEVYGTHDRFYRTSLGNPHAYSAGSGPHAHANKIALQDPVNNPLWKNYCVAALVHAAMGRPEAKQVLAVDPERIKAITLATHAAGGSTVAVHEETVDMAPESERRKSEHMAYELIQDIARLMCASSTEVNIRKPHITMAA